MDLHDWWIVTLTFCFLSLAAIASVLILQNYNLQKKAAALVSTEKALRADLVDWVERCIRLQKHINQRDAEGWKNPHE